MKNNIVLIGFMGAGKTTVGQYLAKKMRKKFIEMDELIVRESRLSSIREIFEKKGEIFFRELEIKIAKKIAREKNSIISTGGGVVVNKIIIDYLKKNSLIVFLKTRFLTIKKRLKNDQNRPLFQDSKKAYQLFQLRKLLYFSYSDFVFETDQKTIDQIGKEILSVLNHKK